MRRKFSSVKRRTKTMTQTKVRNARNEVQCELAAEDGTDQRIEHVIHGHAPSGHVAEDRVQFPAHVSKCRACAGIDTRHSPVAHCGKQHRNHGDQKHCHCMPMRTLGHDSKHRHRRRGLDDDETKQDQVPQAKGTTKMRAFSAGATKLGMGNGCPFVLAPRAARLPIRLWLA